MKTPKEIHINTKGVHRDEVKYLIDNELAPLIDDNDIEIHTIANKIVIHFIRNLETALRIMHSLEATHWLWNEYY